ncbi:metal-sensitive transcriptional regulator [Natroniella sulfidigena]|uniref:metal-sensitive transcriptional regulator n=1 Tax=Natroniella sulfidigena TaxID=723921 RepID=UPI00200AF2D2|nr:metal-sensitive transcriptional regulator [Natroniella sulfidigena]MCK8816965.1 metal-sensitive transcriptional regulator [Natroniella sulfidigena]
MATIKDSDKKEKLLTQLKTIKGHIGGIEKMIEDDKECTELLIQVLAIKSSINKVGLSLIKDNACRCILQSIDEGDEIEDTINEVVTAALKFSK